MVAAALVRYDIALWRRLAAEFLGSAFLAAVVIGSEKLPAISFFSSTTSLTRRALVSAGTSGLSRIGMTTEACMLKACAVEGHPAPSAS